MMISLHRIRESEIHGLGVFAAQFIKKGELVWEYRLNIDQLSLESDFAKQYGFRPFGFKLYIVPCDGAMFVNHSLKPNIGSKDPFTSYALRDIYLNEEITENYREFNEATEL